MHRVHNDRATPLPFLSIPKSKTYLCRGVKTLFKPLARGVLSFEADRL